MTDGATVATVRLTEGGLPALAGAPAAGSGLRSGPAWQLTRQLGPARAREFALTGAPLPAATARDWGLVAAVDERCDARAAGLASGWADTPGAGLVRRGLDTPRLASTFTWTV